MNISFCANKIGTTTIRHLYNPEQRNYEEFEATIVEFDRHNIIDKEIMTETAARFSEYDSHHPNFAQNMKFHFNKVFKNPEIMPTTKFNGLVLPQDDYSDINPKLILGLLETAQDYDAPEITYLQTNPKTNKWAGNFFNPREFKDIGTKLVDYAKEIYVNKIIYVIADYSSMDFYLKARNGFKIARGNLLKYVPEALKKI